MSKRDDYMKFSKEEFRMMLNTAKAKGMPHQKAFDAVKAICDQTVAPKFKHENMHPDAPIIKNGMQEAKNNIIMKFYADIGK